MSDTRTILTKGGLACILNHLLKVLEHQKDNMDVFFVLLFLVFWKGIRFTKFHCERVLASIPECFCQHLAVAQIVFSACLS